MKLGYSLYNDTGGFYKIYNSVYNETDKLVNTSVWDCVNNVTWSINDITMDLELKIK